MTARDGTGATLLDTISRARESGDFSAVTDRIPYARLIGMTVTDEDGDALVRMAVSERVVGNPMLPALHGGVVGALMESAALFQLMWEGQSTHLPKTVNFTVEYYRSPKVEDTFARATILRRGRRIANLRVEAWQDDRDKPICGAHGHFLLQP